MQANNEQFVIMETKHNSELEQNKNKTIKRLTTPINTLLEILIGSSPHLLGGRFRRYVTKRLETCQKLWQLVANYLNIEDEFWP